MIKSICIAHKVDGRIVAVDKVSKAYYNFHIKEFHTAGWFHIPRKVYKRTVRDFKIWQERRRVNALIKNTIAEREHIKKSVIVKDTPERKLVAYKSNPVSNVNVSIVTKLKAWVVGIIARYFGVAMFYLT